MQVHKTAHGRKIEQANWEVVNPSRGQSLESMLVNVGRLDTRDRLDRAVRQAPLDVEPVERTSYSPGANLSCLLGVLMDQANDNEMTLYKLRVKNWKHGLGILAMLYFGFIVLATWSAGWFNTQVFPGNGSDPGLVVEIAAVVVVTLASVWYIMQYPRKPMFIKPKL